MPTPLLDLSARPRRRDGYALESFGDEIVIYHPASEAIFHCNATAALIWQLCDGQRSFGEIVDLLRDAYPEAAAQLQQDVSATLSQLLTHGALEWA
jgi:hypothetical protein